jgi:hypothetical protein
MTNYDVTVTDTNERYFSLDKSILTTDVSFNIYLQRMYTYYRNLTENFSMEFEKYLKFCNFINRPLYFLVGNIFPSLILNLVVIFLFALPFGVQIGGCKKKRFIFIANFPFNFLL